MFAGERLPVKQMPSSEVHNKTIKVNGLTVPQVSFESVGVCQALHCQKNMGGPTIGRPRAEPYVSMQNLFYCGAVSLWCSKTAAAQNQSNCRGSRQHSRMIHQEGVVTLTPNNF